MGWLGDAWDWTASEVSDLGGKVVSDVTGIGDTIGDTVTGIYDLGASGVDATGDLYNDVTGVTASREARDAQHDALDSAQRYQQQQYQEAKGLLSPYAEMGTKDYGSGSALQRIGEGITSGAYTPDAFNYGGNVTNPTDFRYQKTSLGYDGKPTVPAGYIGQQQGFTGYSGQQQGKMNYGGTGQQGSTGYSGTPLSDLNYGGQQVSGTIQDYMGDIESNPAYKFRMDQGLKALDRQASAGGRWGGGQTAQGIMDYSQGLASQEYEKAFNRANLQRQSDIAQEKDLYGRNLTEFGIGRDAEQETRTRAMQDLALRNQAEQSQYNRESTAFDRVNQAEMEGRRRSLEDLALTNQAEQSRYDRTQDYTQQLRDAEQEAYQRADSEYGRQTARDLENYRRDQLYGQQQRETEQELYKRALNQYELDQGVKEGELANLMTLLNSGRSASGALANNAIGQGSSLADLAIQRGNATAASKMAEGQSLQNLLDLGKSGVELYNAVG